MVQFFNSVEDDRRHLSVLNNIAKSLDDAI